MQSFWQDVRYGLRMLGKNPGFTAIAVVTLALGIGVNTAIFTMFNTLLRPLPVKDPDMVVRIESNLHGSRFSFPEFAYYRDHSQVFSDLIAYADEKVLLGGNTASEEAEEVTGDFVSENFFSTLGANAALGHTFSSAEDHSLDKESIVVLSNRFWQKRFAGDPGIVGRTLLLNGKSFTVIGVAEREFVGLRREMPDIWLPIAMRAEMPSVWYSVADKEDWFNKRSFQWVQISARLKPGVTVEQGRAELSVLQSQMAQQWREIDSADRLSVTPISGFGAVDRTAWRTFGIILLSTGIVLLIACSNIANLLLARAAVRQKEIGVRLSLGASRWRVIRQLLTESLLLSLFGGGVGLLFSWWTLELFVMKFISSNGGANTDNLVLNLMPDARILGFTFLLALLSGLVFGIAPALRATRLDPITMMKDEGSAFGLGITRSWLHNGLVVAQVALCLVLLIPAGLLLRGLVQALVSDPGFETKKLLVVGYSLELSGYDKQRAQLFKEQLRARLASLPGVESVSAGDQPLLNVGRLTLSLPETNETAERQAYRTSFNEVAPGWFDTVGIPILRGRGFDAADIQADASVVVVSETTARNLWGDQDPLGKIVQLEPNAKANESGTARISTAQVIGIAKDAQNDRLGSIPPYFIYLPEETRQTLDTTLLVRTSGEAKEMKALVSAEVRAIEPVIRLWLNSMEENIASSKRVGETRAASQLAAGLGLLALLLAAVGLYGVMAYSVTQRTREIGVRLALGAQQRDILRMVLQQGLRLVLVGLLIGIPASLVMTRLLSSFLFGLSSTDPASFAGVSLLLAVVALLACYIPARRGAKTDPMVALRYE